jgi:hypothetical protein
MSDPIKRPLQKWATTMVLVALQFFGLGIVGAALLVLLPASEYGNILLVVAALGIVPSIAIGAIIHWLTRE